MDTGGSGRSSELLQVEVQPDRDRAVVALAGELDMGTVAQPAATVAELRRVGFSSICVDLRGLTFIDSAGVRFLLQLSRAGEDGMQIDVVPGPPAVQRVFQLTGVAKLIPFAPVRSAATNPLLARYRR